MKKLAFFILFLLITVSCFADVTAKIVGVDKDENGNIRVKTQYKIDGVEVKSPYPLENGISYWITRYSVQNFSGMNKTQIFTRIKKDIISFEKHLIIKKYLELANHDFISISQDLVNVTDTQSIASVYVDTDNNGTLDTEWVLKTDGTRIEKEYTP